MNKNINIKIYTLVAILAALASTISIFDKIIISIWFPYIPGIKLGLANVITLYSIYNAKFRYSVLEVTLKVVISSLIFGSITAFIIGGISSFCSFFIMFILFRYFKEKMSIITISISGGFIHIVSQLIITKFIYKLGNEVFSYGIILILVSFVTSIIVGLLTKKMNKLKFIRNMH